MAFVVDNSVVCGWFIANQSTDYTEAVASRLLDEQAHAPPLWRLKFANVPKSACKRGALDAQGGQKITE